MRRICVSPLLLAAALLVAGCGGGGGGGGGGTVTTTLSGRVIGTDGSAIAGAEVTASTDSTRAIVSGITDPNGMYELPRVPVGVSLTITAFKTGVGEKILSGVTIGNDGTSVLDFVLNSEAPPAGCVISITPTATEIYVGQEKDFQVKVTDGYGNLFYPTRDPSWIASWMVTGGARALASTDPTVFEVIGENTSSEAKVTALVPREDGTLASRTLVMEVLTGDLPPGPPPF